MQHKLFYLLFLLGFLILAMNQLTAQTPPPCGQTPAYVCEDDGDGFATFDLVSTYPFSFCFSSDLVDQYYPTKYYESNSDAQNDLNPIETPEAYVNITAFSQEVWFRAEKINPGVGTTSPDIAFASDFINVQAGPIANVPQSFIKCQVSDTGYALFDLNSKRSEIIGNQTEVNLTFHLTYDDAINLVNPLNSQYTNTVPNLQTIFASVALIDIEFTTNCIKVVEFDLIVTDDCEDISVELIRASQNPRPGFDYINRLYVTNESLAGVVSGTVEFIYDDMLQYDSIDLSTQDVNAVITSDGFNISFTDLEPDESFYVEIYFTLPATTPLDTIITNSASYITQENDINPENNFSILTTVVVGSYDPNDKMESHGPQVEYDDFRASNEYLYYTIRFQNIGTAEAIFVRIEDVLDAQLDESTFQMLRSSHDYVVTRTGNNLEWFFEAINLPAEQDDASGSNGFVYFKIRPKSGYAVGDVIPNTAAIYFDFNAPIVTNTFTTEFVEPLSVDAFEGVAFEMYPNPTNELVTIELLSNNLGDEVVRIYNIQGKEIQKPIEFEGNRSTLDISGLQSGLYFVKLTSGNRIKVQKLIVN